MCVISLTLEHVNQMYDKNAWAKAQIKSKPFETQKIQERK